MSVTWYTHVTHRLQIYMCAHIHMIPRVELCYRSKIQRWSLYLITLLATVTILRNTQITVTLYVRLSHQRSLLDGWRRI
jgi:hypothetical protein